MPRQIPVLSPFLNHPNHDHHQNGGSNSTTSNGNGTSNGNSTSNSTGTGTGTSTTTSNGTTTNWGSRRITSRAPGALFYFFLFTNVYLLIDYAYGHHHMTTANPPQEGGFFIFISYEYGWSSPLIGWFYWVNPLPRILCERRVLLVLFYFVFGLFFILKKYSVGYLILLVPYFE